MSDATHVAIIKTGHAHRVVAIDQGVLRNAGEQAAMGEIAALVTRAGRGASLISHHHPDGASLPPRASAVLFELGAVAGSMAVGDLIDSAGINPRSASDHGLDALQTQLRDLRRLLEPDTGQGGVRMIVAQGSKQDTRYELRPPRGQSVWLVMERSEYADGYGLRETADTPPLDELEVVSGRAGTGDRVMQHVSLEAARGPALTALVGHVGALEGTGFAGDEVAVGALVENHGLRQVLVEQIVVIVRPPGRWAGRRIHDPELPASLSPVSLAGRIAGPPGIESDWLASNTGQSWRIEAGGRRACWLRVPVSKLRACAIDGGVEVAIVVIGQKAGEPVEFASELVRVDVPGHQE